MLQWQGFYRQSINFCVENNIYFFIGLKLLLVVENRFVGKSKVLYIVWLTLKQK